MLTIQSANLYKLNTAVLINTFFKKSLNEKYFDNKVNLIPLKFKFENKEDKKFNKLFCLNKSVSGENFSSKINKVKKYMSKYKINYLYVIPIEKGFTFAHYIDAAVDWVWETFFYSLNSFNKFLLTEVLGPMKKAYLGMPVVATLTLTMGVAYIIGGIRTSLLVGGMMLFIAMSKYWDRALITMYMATFAVIMASLNGIIVGSIFAQTERGSKIILSVCDFFETFPSFVYLIPVIFLFNITDTSVLIAAIVYATVPATRYTVWGLNSVPLSLHEAGTMSGVSRIQRWTNIEIPLAFPTIMLGVNQTVVFTLQMVILGALIGTEDLGQLIFGALSRAQDGPGVAITLGLFVSLMAISVDVIVRKWAEERKKALGLA